MNLQLSLKKQWFEMTETGIKKEDYREITPYWIKRLVDKDIFKYTSTDEFLQWYNNMPKGVTLNHVVNQFTTNTMTLGYPSKTDTARILKFKHEGIEIRTGNPEWGAEPNKIYFVVKHGEVVG